MKQDYVKMHCAAMLCVKAMLTRGAKQNCVEQNFAKRSCAELDVADMRKVVLNSQRTSGESILRAGSQTTRRLPQGSS